MSVLPVDATEGAFNGLTDRGRHGTLAGFVGLTEPIDATAGEPQEIATHLSDRLAGEASEFAVQLHQLELLKTAIDAVEPVDALALPDEEGLFERGGGDDGVVITLIDPDDVQREVERGVVEEVGEG